MFLTVLVLAQPGCHGYNASKRLSLLLLLLLLLLLFLLLYYNMKIILM